MKAGLWILLAASSCLASQVFAQDTANPATADPQLHPPSPSLPSDKTPPAQACPRFADRDWPIRSTIQARLTLAMDAEHLKPGKEIYARVMYPIRYADCPLDDNAIIYGHITAAGFSRETKTSELGLEFDHADCTGHPKQQVRLRLIGVVAPPEHSEMQHSALPSEVSGGVMGLPSTSQDGVDDNLTPDYFPRTVHPGLVIRMPKVTLEPEGAPGCTARLSGRDRPVEVMPGTALIMTLGKLQQSKLQGAP